MHKAKELQLVDRGASIVAGAGAELLQNFIFDLEVFFPCNFFQPLEETFLARFPHFDLQGHLAKWLEGSAKEVVADENNRSSQH